MNKQRLLKSIFMILCLAISNARVLATDAEDALHAMREGDFAEAYCVLRPLANAGDAEAQYNIGWMYLNGYGLAINDSLALEWWQRASDQGYIDASFSLAMLYGLGEGQVKKDFNLSLDYYLIAIVDGHEDATLIVKSMLLRDDRNIRGRAPEILKKHASAFGEERQIRVKRANIRKGPGLEHKITKVLQQEDIVFELTKQGKWSQIVVYEGDAIYWVFSSLLEPFFDDDE